VGPRWLDACSTSGAAQAVALHDIDGAKGDAEVLAPPARNCCSMAASMTTGCTRSGAAHDPVPDRVDARRDGGEPVVHP
jgi:hypothetical protein